MRTHLAKSLQTRCRAIRNAVNKYNAVALAINRPTVDWQKVSHFSFLEEFTLLRETRQDVLSKPWTQPLVRLAMQQNRRVKRAREEIARLNVEVRRLHTWILDEQDDVSQVLRQLHAEQSPLYGAVEEYWTVRRRVNWDLLARLRRIYSLPGFTGTPEPGVRIGRTPHARAPVPPPEEQHFYMMEVDDLQEAEHAVEDDEVRERMDDITEYVSRLSLRT